MAKIEQLHDNALNEDFYPVTLIDAVYDKTGKSFQNILNDIVKDFDNNISDSKEDFNEKTSDTIGESDIYNMLDEIRGELNEKLDYFEEGLFPSPTIEYTTIDDQPLENTGIEKWIVSHKKVGDYWEIKLPKDFEEFPDYSFSQLSDKIVNISFEGFDNLKKIGNYFLGEYRFRGYDIEQTITKISLCDMPKLESIGNNFIDLTIYEDDNIGNYDFNYSLKYLIFGDKYNLKIIGENFVKSCCGLSPVDLSPLSNVTSIGNSFLSFCYNLTSIDLSPLSKVTLIGDDFLSYCSGLTSIDLSPLSKVTSIGNSFLSFCYNLKSIDLSPLSKVTSIGNSFLSFCYNLTSIDLSSLSQVTSIGSNFLFNCSGLTSIDLSPLSKVTSIGNNFLYYCSGLTSIISPSNLVTSKIYKHSSLISSYDVLHNITSLTLLGPEIHTSLGTQWNGSYVNKKLKIYVPDNLLNQYREEFPELYYRFYCIEEESNHLGDIPYIKYTTTNKQKIDESLTKIENYIIDHYWDDQEQAFFIQIIPEIEEFPDYAFSELSDQLVNISFENFDNLKKIGNYFLSEYRWKGNKITPRITSISFGDMPKLESIGNSFIELHVYSSSSGGGANFSLNNIYFSNNYNNLTAIGNNFLSFCCGLSSVDLSSLYKITYLGNYFLGYCRGLTSVDLSPLSQVTSIGNYFLAGCSDLISIDLSPLSQVTSIGNGFLSSCQSLMSIDLSPLSQVTSIGNGFLAYCYNLDSIDLSPLSKVISIGNEFLRNCFGLDSIDLSGLTQITSIGHSFLMYCLGLVSIISPNDIVTSKIYKDYYSMVSDDFIHNIISLTLLGLNIHISLSTQWEGDYINPDLKIYVPENLLEEYKSTFIELSNRFYAIS